VHDLVEHAADNAALGQGVEQTADHQKEEKAHGVFFGDVFRTGFFVSEDIINVLTY